jgi:hypothetical protein
LIATVCEEPVSLQQASRTDETIGVPPERRATRRATRAQDTLVKPIELCAILGRLKPFDCRRWRIVLQERFNFLVLSVKQTHIDYEIAHDRQAR